MNVKPAGTNAFIPERFVARNSWTIIYANVPNVTRKYSGTGEEIGTNRRRLIRRVKIITKNGFFLGRRLRESRLLF